MAEYDLIKIREFVHKGNPTGKEEIPIADASGTYKTPADTLIAMVATTNGFIKGTALIPLNNAISQKADKSALIPINNAIAGKIDKTAVVDNLNSNSATAPVSAKQAKILNDKIAGFASQVGTGIIGEATPETDPISEGFGIYTVSIPGIYVNFKDINGDPIEVTEENLTAGNGGLVQLWGNDGVWEKHVTIIEDGMDSPQTDDDIFDI